jgi:predicted dehydrogenase
MEKIRVCIVGIGRIATLNVLGYKDNPDAEIYAVCSRNEEKGRKAAEEWKAQKVYTDYDEMLKDPKIDMVELLVPHNLHCEMTIKACEAGKHVSVQKPMAMNLKECDLMIEAAKKAGVKLKVYENFISIRALCQGEAAHRGRHHRRAHYDEIQNECRKADPWVERRRRHLEVEDGGGDLRWRAAGFRRRVS